MRLRRMAPGMKFWGDWVDKDDMEAMWNHPDVQKEWLAAGESRGKKVHMPRNPDGQPYITQVEMRAIAEIITSKYFKKRIDVAMVCAIAEIESDRQPLTQRYDPLNEECTGLMQISKSRADWISRDMGCRAYTVDWTASMLYRPFESVYFGVAYLKWLSSYERKKRSEEFVVRAYHSGPEHAAHKSSLQYWNKYLIAKQSLPFHRDLPQQEPSSLESSPVGSVVASTSPSPGKIWVYWDERTSTEDMEEMWRNPDVKREWSRAGEVHGKVRFSRDDDMRPYLTKIELKGVAEIIVSRYFMERGVNPAMLCTIAEISSKRLLHGIDPPTGIMQIPYQRALWIYTDLGYKAYRIKSVEDLSKPFVSMYFGAAYVCWLYNFKGRSRADQFVVQAYRVGPEAVDSAEAGPFWLKYIDTLPEYLHRPKNNQSSCSIQ